MQKKSRKLFVLALVLVWTVCSLIGCGGPSMSPDAHALIDYYRNALRDYQFASEIYERQRVECEESAKSEQDSQKRSEAQKKCTAQYQEHSTNAQTHFVKRVNIRFRNACKIPAVIGVTLDPKQDHDGDGIEDHWELNLGLSPCHAQTFVGQPDGELDSDFDGKPNSSDENPFCHPDYPSDCV